MSDVKPAMTAEEWAVGEPAEAPVQWHIDWGLGVVDVSIDGDDHRHALAALALHGQPFGFTWDDVDRLRERAVTAGDDALADRIAALLPPR